MISTCLILTSTMAKAAAKSNKTYKEMTHREIQELIDNKTLKLVKRTDLHADCWNHFRGIKDVKTNKFVTGRSKCIHCGEIFTGKDGNTTILNRHIKKCPKIAKTEKDNQKETKQKYKDIKEQVLLKI